MYLLGIILLGILFGFGSYVKDTQADVSRTSRLLSQNVFGGIFPADHENLEFINEENPDIVIVISSTDEVYEGSSIIIKDNGYELGIVDMLDKSDFVSINNDILFNVDVPHQRVIPVLFTPNVSAIESYRFAKLLEETAIATNRKVFVLALTQWSDSEIPHIQELQDLTTQRALHNLEISSVNKLNVGDANVVRSVLYYFNFVNGKTAVAESSGVIYERGDESERINRTTLFGFGDVMLGRQVRVLMDRNTMNYPFEKISHEIGGTDFVSANLEGPIKEVPVATSKSIAFRFKPDIVQVLKDANIDIVTTANNHALDQGWGGRSDTMKFLREGGIAFFGHPKNEREENVYVTGMSGEYVAFVGFDDTIFKIDSEDASAFIKELDAQYDRVIVSIHWGLEYKHQPTQRKIDLAHAFVDSGADLVIGHHPHVVQTMEIYNDVPIFYSLGNFVFDQYFSIDTQEGLGIGAVLEDEQTVLYLLPYIIPNSQPTFMNEEEKAAFLEKFISWGVYEEEFAEQIRGGKIVLPKD